MRKHQAASIVAVLATAGTMLGAAAPATSQAATRPLATSGGVTAAPTAKYGYSADAYGTKITVGKLLKSGATARAPIGCTLQPGRNKANDLTAVTLPGLGAGAVTDKVSTASVKGDPTASAMSSVAGVSIGGGLITVGAVTATSSASHRPTHFATTGSVSLLDLTVDGTALPADPAPNTTISVPALGTLILNHEIKTVTASAATITVQAIRLKVTVANSLGLALGATIVIGDAHSGLLGPVSGLVGGQAFGTSVKAGTVAKLGQTAVADVPCQGTGGKVQTNTTAGVDLGFLSEGTVTSTDEGDTANGTPLQAATTDTVANVNLLPGALSSVLTVQAVKASASASVVNGKPKLSETGSQIVGLSVAGVPMNGNVAPNTTISIPLVGTLTLNKVITSGRSIDVRMIQLVLSVPLDGLAAGTTVIIASAQADLR